MYVSLRIRCRGDEFERCPKVEIYEARKAIHTYQITRGRNGSRKMDNGGRWGVWGLIMEVV